MQVSKLDKATRVLAKLVEIALWIGTVGMLVGLALVLLFGEKAVVGAAQPGETAAAWGFEIMVADFTGTLDLKALMVFLSGGAVLMGLMAMVFRNVYRILKGSEGSTPFTADNVRMVREIGYFLIAVPAAGLVMSIIAQLILGPGVTEVRVNMGELLVGLVVLSLSRIFARGMELEADTEGLV